MFSENALLVILAAALLWIAGLIGIYWPWSKIRRFTIRRRINAARDRVWKVFYVDLDDPDSAALYSSLSAARRVDQDPSLWELVLKEQGTHGAGSAIMRHRILLEQPPQHLTTRLEQLGDTVFSNDQGYVAALTFTETAERTEAVFDWRGLTVNLWHYIQMWRSERRFMLRLAQISEAASAAEAATDDKIL